MNKQKRTVFNLRLYHEQENYTFEFGQSIAQGNNEPSMYDEEVSILRISEGIFLFVSVREQ